MANNYNPYSNNIYMQEMQSMKDRIDRQMQQYQQSQNQFMQQQQPQIQQTFQLNNPNQSTNDFDGKYAETIEDVRNTLVYKNSVFLNKDMNKMWIKDAGGNIRIFGLQEEIPVDENVAEINNLKQEVGELKALIIQQLQTQKAQSVQTVQQGTIESESKSQIVGKMQPITKVERKSK